ncbi:MAG TPA: DMT family transporter [Gaiellaceae bacterium]|nr:DMT family transporter [Gaiellaceae bacterium]
MTAILLALGASLAWGVADFVGPWKARALGALRVMLWAQFGGLTAITIVVAIHATRPHDWALLLAIPAALSGTLGLYAYYRGMAVGAMAVVAPIAGASAIVPVIFGLATGDRPSPAQIAGIACALLGVGLASQEHQEGQRQIASGVGLAILAAIGFGFHFPAMHAAGKADALWASLVFRLAAAAIVLVAVIIRRPPIRVSGRNLWIVLGVGVGDTLGNVLFAGSASRGLVSLTSVLASLYPVITVALAALTLKERVASLQRVGIVLTLAGVALISA